MFVQPKPQDGSPMELLAAHLHSLEPAGPSARERLEEVLGVELTQKLLFALAPGATGTRRAA
jgi:hypothetical protein